jgi:hypothetical protein
MTKNQEFVIVDIFDGGVGKLGKEDQEMLTGKSNRLKLGLHFCDDSFQCSYYINCFDYEFGCTLKLDLLREYIQGLDDRPFRSISGNTQPIPTPSISSRETR